MNVEVVAPEQLGARAAEVIADDLRAAIDARGVATLALSGGSTPAPMLRALATSAVPWDRVHVLQVDERVAAEGDPARNLVGLERDLLRRLDVPPAGVHPLPADLARTDPAAAATAATSTLLEVAGAPPRIDVVHLGLGDDAHTASLVPGDPVLEETAAGVAVTGPYRGHRRLTLTFPVLAAARHLVWLVAGATKAAPLARVLATAPDETSELPAARLPTDRASFVVDHAAAADLRDLET